MTLAKVNAAIDCGGPPQPELAAKLFIAASTGYVGDVYGKPNVRTQTPALERVRVWWFGVL